MNTRSQQKLSTMMPSATYYQISCTNLQMWSHGGDEAILQQHIRGNSPVRIDDRSALQTCSSNSIEPSEQSRDGILALHWVCLPT